MSVVGVSSTLRYTLHETTSFVFTIAAQSTSGQSLLDERLTVEPTDHRELAEVGDAGNRVFRVLGQPGELTVRYDALVRLWPASAIPGHLDETPHIEVPGEILPYLNPSRYCESDRLGYWAKAEFGDCPPGYGRVTAVCDRIGAYLSYQPGSTDSLTTACDVLVQRAGVCRDFAHLGIAVCRALGIPARYVSGYAPGIEPPDFHGLFEAYLGSAWYLFDPTGKAVLTNFVRIAAGRDAADASFATFVGHASLDEISVSAHVRPVAPPVKPSA